MARPVAGLCLILMRLALWFLGLAALVLGTWLVWGGRWDEHFTLAGSVKWLESAGPWAWAAGFALLVGDLFLPVPGTIVISALGLIYGVLLGGLVASAGLMAAGLSVTDWGCLFGESSRVDGWEIWIMKGEDCSSPPAGDGWSPCRGRCRFYPRSFPAPRDWCGCRSGALWWRLRVAACRWDFSLRRSARPAVKRPAGRSA